MTGIYKEVEPAPGKKAHSIVGFTCDGCGSTISFEDRRKNKTWASGHHGFLDQKGGYVPFDGCSVECFAKALTIFMENNPSCQEIEILNMGIEFAKALVGSLKK